MADTLWTLVDKRRTNMVSSNPRTNTAAVPAVCTYFCCPKMHVFFDQSALTASMNTHVQTCSMMLLAGSIYLQWQLILTWFLFSSLCSITSGWLFIDALSRQHLLAVTVDIDLISLLESVKHHNWLAVHQDKASCSRTTQSFPKKRSDQRNPIGHPLQFPRAVPCRFAFWAGYSLQCEWQCGRHPTSSVSMSSAKSATAKRNNVNKNILWSLSFSWVWR